MSLEIERKFLVQAEDWRSLATSSRNLKQFYLATEQRSSVRIRIEEAVGAWLTVKSAQSGAKRSEFEYPIPIEDAEQMTAMAAGAVIEKVRHIVPFAGLDWEVDDFAGDNEGLVVAEVELRSEDQKFELPRWIGKEVTDDKRYYNASLSEMPFKSW
jgi:adenylate cyclase